MNMGNKKKFLILITIIVVLGFIISLALFNKRTFEINEWVVYGKSETYSISGYCSYLNVSLAAKHSGMNIKIIIDNSTVYVRSDTLSVNYDKNIGFGNHEIQIHMENPSIFGFNMEILVSGKVTISLF
jgi:hypothetical protein